MTQPLDQSTLRAVTEPPNVIETLQAERLDVRVPPPRWRGWLATGIAALLLWSAVGDVLEPDPDARDSTLQIDSGSDEEAAREARIQSVDGNEEPIVLDLGEVESETTADALAREAVEDPEHFDEALAERRFAVNLLLVHEADQARHGWVAPTKRVLDWASLLGLLLLLGPVWAFGRLPAATRLRDAIRLVPPFAVAGAAVSVAIGFVGTIVIDLQSFQLTFLAIGGLKPSLADATIHFLTTSPHPEAAALLSELSSAMAAGGVESLALFGVFWTAAAEAADSAWLGAAATVIGWSGSIMTLYAVGIGLITAVVTVRVVTPRVGRIVQYPFALVSSQSDETAGAFLWRQFKLLWREIRIMMWVVLFVLVVLVFAVLLVRAFAFPVAWVSLDVLVTAFARVEAGDGLPDVLIFFSGLSLGLFTLVGSTAVLAPLTLLVSRSRWIHEARIMDGRRFRTFVGYWAMLRLAVRAVGRTLLATLLAVAVYAGLRAVFGIAASLWLPLLLAPMLGGLLVWFGTPKLWWEAVRIDVLAVPSPALSASPEDSADRAQD